MSSTTEYRAPTSGDADILVAFEKIATELEQDPERSRVGVEIMEQLGSNPSSFPLSQIMSQPFVKHAKTQGGATWESVRIDYEPLALRVILQRDRQQGDDVVRTSFRRDPSDPVDAIRSLDAIQRRFVPLNRAQAIERALGPEIAEFYRLREEGLSRLEALTRKLVEETHDYRLRLDTKADERRQTLTTAFDDKSRVLEEQYKERMAALEDRERNLDEQRRELDDRSARHARREKGRALQQRISERSKKFTLTPETERKRWPVHGIFALLLLVSGGLVARSLLWPAVSTEGMALWFELARLPLGALGFALTSVFYIRWNDEWFRQHADEEFRLQQLALDVDRAGYATEMLLEWQEEKDGDMPAVMVDRLTSGLFTDQATVARVRHPTEDVTAALLKASSGVRVELPGIGEVNLTGRQVRKFERSLQKKEEG